MNYKVILVHVDDSRNAESRINAAADIALQEEACLIGLATTGINAYSAGGLTVRARSPEITAYLDARSRQADVALQRFNEIAAKRKLVSFEGVKSHDDAGRGVALHARYADLLVLGQLNRSEPAPGVASDFPESVVMESNRPALILPYTGHFEVIGKRILLAWNQGDEALNAVRGALPILRRADSVDLVWFERGRARSGAPANATADIESYLARHGVEVSALRIATDLDIGNAMLNQSAAANIDLIVMGCYGHSKLHEVLLGGATRTILQSMTVPVLMAH